MAVEDASLAAALALVLALPQLEHCPRHYAQRALRCWDLGNDFAWRTHGEMRCDECEEVGAHDAPCFITLHVLSCT